MWHPHGRSGVSREDHKARLLLAFTLKRRLSKDASEFVKKCDACQHFANIIHVPPNQQNPILSPWPFAQWGVDTLGPFPIAYGQRWFIVLAMDYFTKWIEAEALATITTQKVINFFVEGGDISIQST